MWKVILVFMSVLALVFFFTGDFFLSAPASTENTANKLETLAKLDKEVEESSGIEQIPGTNNKYLTHNDAGNKPRLYQINEQGEVEQTYKPDLPNVDWEDLTQDNSGNFYIADTGNNSNKRRELAIYKLKLGNLEQAQAIRFSYEDQDEFPPSKKDRNFDSEAIFWHNNKLYLISKDRGRSETAKVYQLPDQPGKYQAKLIGSIKVKAQITGAAISSNAETIALLSDEKLHIINGFNSVENFYEGELQNISLKEAGQTEGVTFINDNTLMLTSEGGNLYRYSLQTASSATHQ
ncbi:hypothetical protein [Pontibacter silvestris]|nr:hypothetical protein [Pontibacter silvestris]MCC9136219.1 hypothetical protein [Pontibacter silvestris]